MQNDAFARQGGNCVYDNLATESAFLSRVYGLRRVRFGSKANMCSAQADVRLVPIADMGRLFDHVIGASNE
jgi:hypothetical protein